MPTELVVLSCFFLVGLWLVSRTLAAAYRRAEAAAEQRIARLERSANRVSAQLLEVTKPMAAIRSANAAPPDTAPDSGEPSPKHNGHVRGPMQFGHSRLVPLPSDADDLDGEF